MRFEKSKCSILPCHTWVVPECICYSLCVSRVTRSIKSSLFKEIKWKTRIDLFCTVLISDVNRNRYTISSGINGRRVSHTLSESGKTNELSIQAEIVAAKIWTPKPDLNLVESWRFVSFASLCFWRFIFLECYTRYSGQGNMKTLSYHRHICEIRNVNFYSD